MSGPWHPTGRGRVNSRSPQALAVCDFCYQTYNLVDLRAWQQWAGAKLQTYNYLVCAECWDIPQMQLRSIVIPPDPVPVFNPRPEQYSATVPSYMATESQTFSGSDLTTQSDNNLIWEIEDTPLPDPNNPVLYPD